MNKKIALVTGGYSGEALISYKTALAIEKNIDRSKWDHFKIDIRSDGWFYLHPDGEQFPVDKNDFSITIKGDKIVFDAVFIALHGTPGEDGKLQGYFDCLNIPYSSCDAATSALTFNKRYTVAVASFAGMHVARSLHLFRDEPMAPAEILSALQLPLFVKPNNGGSSIGMSKVKRAEELPDALGKAFKEDDQVLVEEFISGREFTIGLFRSKRKIVSLPITEIISKNEFFDFEAKYLGASEEITPARLNEDIAGKIREEARKAYSVFNCRGIVRMDYIYEENSGIPFLLEINTVPGQTEESLIPQQVKAMGLTLMEFYSLLIEECFE